MTDVVQFEAYKTLKEAKGMVDVLRRQTEAALKSMLKLDVTNMNGKQLETIRDGCIRLRWLLAVSEPEAQARIDAKLAEAGGRRLTAEEITACVLVPPRVSFG